MNDTKGAVTVAPGTTRDDAIPDPHNTPMPTKAGDTRANPPAAGATMLSRRATWRASW